MNGQILTIAGGYKLLQNDLHHKLGTDSVLLANFTRLRKGDRICDLGCGVGALTLLLAARRPDVVFDSVDIQPDALKLFARSVHLNRLQNRIQIIEADFRKQSKILRAGDYQVVVSNPPYIPVTGGLKSDVLGRRIARCETLSTVTDVCYAARRLLQSGGLFFVVYRPDRLCDLLTTMHDFDMEPKRMRFVCHTADKEPSLVMVEGNRGARPGLTVEPMLVMYDAQGFPTDELLEIYGREDLMRDVRSREENALNEEYMSDEDIEAAIRDEQITLERRREERRWEMAEADESGLFGDIEDED